MLHLDTPCVNNKNKPRLVYWKVVIAFPHINPLEFKVSTLAEFALITGIKYVTLRRIVYDKNYNSKKYNDLLQYTTVTPVYN